MGLLMECIRDCNRALVISPSYAKVKMLPSFGFACGYCITMLLGTNLLLPLFSCNQLSGTFWIGSCQKKKEKKKGKARREKRKWEGKGKYEIVGKKEKTKEKKKNQNS